MSLSDSGRYLRTLALGSLASSQAPLRETVVVCLS